MDKNVQFPELNYQSACKVCQLRDTHPNILRYIHKLRLEENKGWSAIVEEISALWNDAEPPPSMSSIRRHFLNDHVTLSRYVYPKDGSRSSSKILTEARLNIDHNEISSKNPKLRSASSQIKTELDTLWIMQETLKEVFVQIDGDKSSLYTEDGRLNKDAFTVWSNLANSTRQIITELKKLRQSEELTSLILQQTLIRFAKKISVPIRNTVLELAQEVYHLEGSDAIQSRAAYFLDEGLYYLVADSADEVIADIRNEYKLASK